MLLLRIAGPQQIEMPMALLLNWRLWLFLAIAGLLTFTHVTAVRYGKNQVRLEWKAAVAASDLEARRLEQRRADRATEATALSVTRNTQLRADLVRTGDQLVGMRSTLDATERRAKESAEASARVVSAYRAVFESCTAEYRAMAAEAAGHASDSLMYQEAWPR